MSEYQNALAKFLLSEKNAFAEPQRMLWPARRDPYTGDMGFGHSMFTESLVNGLSFPAKVMRGEVPMFAEYGDGKVHYSPEMIQGANDTAGLAMTGAIGLPKPANAVGSGGGKMQATNVAERQSLPMDQASRMARAREMGFDTDNVLYHGTDKSFDSFKASGDGHFLGRGVYATPDPNYASFYPIDTIENASIMPLYARGSIADMADVPRAVTRWDWRNSVLAQQLRGEQVKQTPDKFERAAQWARDNGHAGLRYGNETVIFDPSNIRSVNAAFDPAKSSSANLLAANPREGAAAAQAANAGQQDDNQLMNLLRQYGLY